MLGALVSSSVSAGCRGWCRNSHYPLIGALLVECADGVLWFAMGWPLSGWPSRTTSLNWATRTDAAGVRGQQQASGFIFKFFPARSDRVRDFCYRHARRDQPARPLIWPKQNPADCWIHTQVHGPRWSLFMLEQDAAMDRRLFNRGHALAADGCVRSCRKCPRGNLSSRSFPASTFLGVAAITFVGVARMPSQSFFKDGASGLRFSRRAAWLYRAAAGDCILRPVGGSQREGIHYVYWFLLKVAIFICLSGSV